MCDYASSNRRSYLWFLGSALKLTAQIAVLFEIGSLLSILFGALDHLCSQFSFQRSNDRSEGNSMSLWA
jgi:hypothetical protein